jgi:hypothetical protein
VAIVDRMILTTIANIRAWDPEMQEELLVEEGVNAAGLGDVDDYVECLQHFAQVAGRKAPNGGGVPPLREDTPVCVPYF